MTDWTWTGTSPETVGELNGVLNPKMKALENKLAGVQSDLGIFNVIDYGAVGDSVTDDRTAIADADSAADSTLFFPQGTYKISSNITISSDCFFESGAVLTPDTGVTVTLGGSVNAGVYQIFDASLGTITLASPLAVNHIVWWGAVGDGSTDDKTAIDQALAAGDLAVGAYGQTHFAYDESGSGLQTNNAIDATVKDLNLTAPARLLLLGNKQTDSNMSTNRFLQKDVLVSASNDYLRDMFRFDRDTTNNSATVATSLFLSTIHHGATTGTVGGHHNITSLCLSDAVAPAEVTAIHCQTASIAGSVPWGLDITCVLTTVQPTVAYGGVIAINDRIGTSLNKSLGLWLRSTGTNRPNYGILMDMGGDNVGSFNRGILINQQTPTTSTVGYMQDGIKISASSTGAANVKGSIDVGLYLTKINTHGVYFDAINASAGRYEIGSSDDLRVELGSSTTDFLGVYKSDDTLGCSLLAGGAVVANGYAFRTASTFGTGDTTPAIGQTTVWTTFASSAGTNISDLDSTDSGSDQLAIIIGGGGATPDILVDAGNLVLNGNWTGNSGDTLVLIQNGGKWHELSRSGN